MKKSIKILILLFLPLLVSTPFVQALEVPDHPEGRITDFTHTLSSSEISRLDRKLAQYENQSTNQIAVLLLPSLEGDNLEDYSIRLAEKWKIGQEGKDNGVIILIVKKDRKLRIEVGYGLEWLLPDGLAGSIIKNEIAPFFKNDQFYNGINQGTDALIKAISPNLKTVKPQAREILQSPGSTSEGKFKPTDIFGCIFFLFIIIFLIYIYIQINKHKEIFGPGASGISGSGFSGSGFSGSGFSGGGFSGGGGGFGGGGASGSW